MLKSEFREKSQRWDSPQKGCEAKLPKMAAERSTIDLNLIWPVGCFYARPTACNNQSMSW